MDKFNLTQLTNDVLDVAMPEQFSGDRAATAMLLAHIAEFDARGRYVEAGYPSMFAYCVKKFRLSEDAAYTRILAARTARRFPFLFPALEEGRLHLTAIRLLEPHLTPENAGELAAAATHLGKSEIERMLARRFGRDGEREPRQVVRAIPTRRVGLPVPEQVDPPFQGLKDRKNDPPADSTAAATAGNGLLTMSDSPAAMTPPTASRAPERYLLQLTMAKSTHDKLRYAQMLLSHAIPSGNIEQVLDRALSLLIDHLQKRKYAATDRPRPRVPLRDGAGLRAQGSWRPRYIPADVKRAVWKRDRGQCTFVGTDGGRCGSRRFLEFDHVDPVARGGKATVEKIRLRCRAHNQHEAARAFGAAFIQAKREAARLARSEAGLNGSRRAPAAAPLERGPAG